jgi:hypothetical protein
MVEDAPGPAEALAEEFLRRLGTYVAQGSPPVSRDTLEAILRQVQIDARREIVAEVPRRERRLLEIRMLDDWEPEDVNDDLALYLLDRELEVWMSDWELQYAVRDGLAEILDVLLADLLKPRVIRGLIWRCYQKGNLSYEDYEEVVATVAAGQSFLGRTEKGEEQ